ncbi:MAG: tRNA (N(6)-L-threonylcarbamoyladenosine(37)-C(2))-methylthiotransferase MtaB [Rhodospirillaceae bacterium]|jgi:threonylcarbamoyladenosine tRNA methylthiotransferase MtaB|nr:tRNA (N(6)-L-threonylcarbamoyladenosine(37)-C(2))-methylthiotransferase MtaB [Rhodospirillaceae bacterium]MBT4219305.1 tRNA (N(6)-L-threonylcarbamoyladenosine(37)-C(2))-methylthiotransferase MtaB [Rhodospirillaceae bacterium]MBT4464933.1 tRNA (N(6)-L-threonylcarbamoyladenosine(37)-C(2))-methylthiotransferase MtaB [Rhodospirillaceae bacterium]MBT5013297.1 tRNA (N(6)-L-threonylcarbamoyladenosine(37)-C(2))-methylthiotransferase MtaB [Rhodospirillaceae bacterium]MBT5308005.1 tRNA (N(6)-L-threony
MSDNRVNSPRVITMGCRLNTLESEMIGAGLTENGINDAIIINTCAVTTEAERRARQTIRKLRRDNPEARLIVTGCAAQISPETFADMEEVDRVVGNAEKLDPRILTGDGPTVEVSDIMEPGALEVPMISGFQERTRAFVQIQQGCDHRCTFCIIPYARGPNRSIESDRIIRQVRTMVENGHAEVVLTGVDISSYDFCGLTLGSLAAMILEQVPELKRLRLSSLDPAAIDDDIYRLLADEDRFMPHLHLSLQAADDMVLKRMKRRHSRTDAMDVIERARKARPDVVFGVDLIAGFPTETDDMFNNTLSAIEDMMLTYLHVFPYSARPGTAAAKMPSVPGNVVRDRAARLRDAGQAAQMAYFKTCVGTEAEVLIEAGRKGHSRHFAPVKLTFDAPVGTITRARIQSIDETALLAGAAT